MFLLTSASRSVCELIALITHLDRFCYLRAPLGLFTYRDEYYRCDDVSYIEARWPIVMYGK